MKQAGSRKKKHRAGHFVGTVEIRPKIQDTKPLSKYQQEKLAASTARKMHEVRRPIVSIHGNHL
jgi:hypothetical protein